MPEGGEGPRPPDDRMGRALHAAARSLAIAGGVMLSLLAALTTVSVAGRSAFSAPVPGDFELVAIGTGLAVFAFLPWCQLTRGNVLVDFFMMRAPARARLACDLVGAAFYLVIGAILTWRTIFGGIDMYRYAEKSMTISFPRWTTFPPSILMLAFLVVVIAYTARRGWAELRAGRRLDDDSSGGP